jgi:hypothetical protein
MATRSGIFVSLDIDVSFPGRAGRFPAPPKPTGCPQRPFAWKGTSSLHIALIGNEETGGLPALSMTLDREPQFASTRSSFADTEGALP